MPFKSEKQRRFLWARHPNIARKWAHEEKKMFAKERREHPTLPKWAIKRIVYDHMKKTR